MAGRIVGKEAQEVARPFSLPAKGQSCPCLYTFRAGELTSTQGNIAHIWTGLTLNVLPTHELPAILFILPLEAPQNPPALISLRDLKQALLHVFVFILSP